LLLDEPTVGVDFQSRELLLARIRHYADAGAGVIYSTHYMEEAERICDRVLLIDRGKLIAEGDLEKVISLGGSRPRIELTYRGQLPDGRFGSLAGVREVGTTVSEGRAILEMDSFAQIAEVLDGLGTLDVNVVDFNLHSPNLSDAFVALTGHTLRDQVH
jgi:ABC-2 type transport system ATP-binding protein